MQYECEGIPYDFPGDVSPSFTISHNECANLKRVLGTHNFTQLPRACKVGATSQNTGILGRFSQPLYSSSDVAGKVNVKECEKLRETLSTIAPTASNMLPSSCSDILQREENELREKFEYENAQVMKQLKRRNTFVAQADYPPTMC